MKSTFILLLSCLLVSTRLYSQKEGKPIDYRFKDGERNFVAFFSKNIHFSDDYIESVILDNSITRISLNPDGEITEILSVNPIDSTFDNEVLRVINLSRKYWIKNLKENHDQLFYIQIGFYIPKYRPNFLERNSVEIKKLFPEPIAILYDNKFKKPFIRSEELSEKLDTAILYNNFPEALIYVNELIKREPFNRDLYKLRIMINIKSNRPEYVNQDDDKIFNFAEGYSIDELTKASSTKDY
jgi:hypothetical protein